MQKTSRRQRRKIQLPPTVEEKMGCYVRLVDEFRRLEEFPANLGSLEFCLALKERKSEIERLAHLAHCALTRSAQKHRVAPDVIESALRPALERQGRKPQKSLQINPGPCMRTNPVFG